MMSSLFLFISSCLIIFIIIGAVVLTSWIKFNKTQTHKLKEIRLAKPNFYQSKNPENLIQVNIDRFHSRLAELEQDFTTNKISESQFINQKIDLQRQLINTCTRIEKSLQIPMVAKISLVGSIIILTTTAYLFSDRTSTLSFLASSHQLEAVADNLLTGRIDQPPSVLTSEDTRVLITLMQKNVHQHAYDSQRWMRLAEFLISMNSTRSAIQCMEKANRLNIHDGNIAINYAKTSYFFNNQVMPAKAQKALEILLKDQPNHQGALMLLIMSETRKGDHTQALKWANKLKKSVQKQLSTNQDPNKYQIQLNSINKLIKIIKNNQINNK